MKTGSRLRRENLVKRIRADRKGFGEEQRHELLIVLDGFGALQCPIVFGFLAD
jgi:hypothetical protein